MHNRFKEAVLIYVLFHGLVMIFVGLKGIYEDLTQIQTMPNMVFVMNAGPIAVGLACVAVYIYFHKKNFDMRNRLISEGFCVDAEFELAIRFTSSEKPYKDGEAANYVIRCSYRNHSDGKIYKYKSDSVRLHFDPSFELRSWKAIPVYIDRNNPQIYYVDLTRLKELEKRRLH